MNKVKFGNKVVEITKKNLKWDRSGQGSIYKQHKTIDNSEPSYPSDTFRPIISHKMRLNGERIYTPFFTLEFLVRYKELFSLCFNGDPKFKKYVNKNLGNDIDIDQLSKDEVSLSLFNFYKSEPQDLFKYIKNLRKQTKLKKSENNIQNLLEKQLPKNKEKKEKDLETRKQRVDVFRSQEVMLNPPKEESPSVVKMASNFVSAMKDFAQSGFLRVTNEQYKARMDICNKCEFWKSDARMGLGKCLKCGCTGAKQWIATSVCPIEKWGAVSKEEVEASKERENAQAQETQGTVSQQADGSTQEPSS